MKVLWLTLELDTTEEEINIEEKKMFDTVLLIKKRVNVKSNLEVSSSYKSL